MNKDGASHRTLKGATISFRGAAIDCLVRNVSDTGACLEVESPVGIPNDFNLVIKADDVTRPCSVAWRAARRIGVHFAEAAAVKLRLCGHDQQWNKRG